MENLWESVKIKFLRKAELMLNTPGIPDDETIYAAAKLVDTAIAIDSLNLQLDMQSQYSAAVFRKSRAKTPVDEISKIIVEEANQRLMAAERR